MEEIDFESWFFDKLIEEDIRVMRCAVADEEKPQESAEMEAIIEEGDDVESTQRSVIVIEKTEDREFVHEDALCQVIRRDEGTRRRPISMRYEKKVPKSSLQKMIVPGDKL
jgi:hypothetical protein